MINLDDKQNQTTMAPILQMGFRPFFLGAGIFAVACMLVWMGVLVFNWPLQFLYQNPVHYHAHEMIFGYGMAVVSGFLLTAVRNWTNIQTLTGSRLLLLFLLWFVIRVLVMFPALGTLAVVAVLETLFFSALIISLAVPVIMAKQWRQLGILVLLTFILVSNIVFYIGLLEKSPGVIMKGLYLGFYFLLGLILMIAGRVMPFFIEKGTDVVLQNRNRPVFERVSLIIFLIYVILEVFYNSLPITAGFAGVLFILHSVRLRDWYTPGIWQRSLLWILYLGYAWFIVGFAIRFLSLFFVISPFLSLHAHAVGVMGGITVGMMARVALGHTGRNVYEPPQSLLAVFLLVLVGGIFRVIMPLLLPDSFLDWIILSQLCWVSGFGLFVVIYFPILIKARVDGMAG